MKKHIGVLAGAFNPLTRAHLALLDAARPHVDELICVVPRVYPHKQFHGAAFEDRIAMLRLAGGHDRIETTSGGLFIDIARELRQGDEELSFLCGRDAAERIIHWNYGERGTIEELLDDFSLLVAARGGAYEPPPHLCHRVRALTLDEDLGDISSTEVRRRIAAGEPWEHLVPASIAAYVRKLYAA